MAMNSDSFITRLRNWLNRALFWLPSAAKQNEERAVEHTHDHNLVLAVIGKERVPRIRQIKHLFRLLTITERRIFLGALAVALISAATALIVFSSGRIVSVPTVGGTFTEAAVGEPKYINPLDAPMNDVDRDLVRLVYSGLFRFDGVNAVPDLAESYTWSDDRKTLSVSLRKDARFHDGQPVTSKDVQFTMESAQDPARKSPILADFRNVTIDAPDDGTVTFQLTQPDGAFLSKLTLGILPAHLWQDIPAANARLSDLNIRPIGSGAYLVKSFSRDNDGAIHSYTLERFDQYYGFRPYLKTVTFQFFTDSPSAIDALKSELVDGVSFVDADNADKIRSSGRKQEIKLNLPQTTVAFFNLKDDILSDQNLREALSLAVNPQDVVTALGGRAEALVGPYPFIAPTSTTLDLARARKILDEAGWVVPQNGNVRIKKAKAVITTGKNKKTETQQTNEPTTETASSTELTLTISVPSDPELATVADVLKRSWSLLGIKVDIDTMATDELMRKATRDRSLQIVLLNILLGPDQDLTPFWWSGQAVDRGLNISNLKDRTVDDALDRLKTATSTDAIDADRNLVSQTILSSTPAVFLVRPMQSSFISTRIQGVPTNMTIAEPAERFASLENWYEKTGWRWK
jgi:peptide/nickel transport system substrate-binding protein